MSDNPELARRWRLILGRYAEQNLPSRAVDNDLESTLSFLMTVPMRNADTDTRRRARVAAWERRS